MNPASYARASPFLSDPDFTAPDPGTSSTSFSSDFSVPTSSGSIPQTPYSSSFTAGQAGSYSNSPLGSDISQYHDAHTGNSPNPASSPFLNTSGTNDEYNFVDIPVFPPDDYDPNDYDAQGSSLLFNDFVTSLDSIQAQQPLQHPASPSPSASSTGSDNPTVSVIPAEQGMHSYGSPYNHGSPASSNGGDDFHLQSLQKRSRASSVSSSHKANSSLDYSTLGMENVNLDSSPSWMSQGPSHPQSPPHIVIPDANGSRQQGQPSPTITNYNQNAVPNMPNMLSSGGMLRNSHLDLDGPGIQVVPATPVSAGNGNAVHGGLGPFPHSMRQQGRSPPSVPSSLSMSHTSPWVQQQQLSDSRGSSPIPGFPQAPQPSYTLASSNNTILTPPSSAGSPNLGNRNNDVLGGLQLGLNGRDDASKSAFAGGSVDDSQFLVPISNTRSRSKSETNMARPSWQLNDFGSMQIGTQQPSQQQGQLQANPQMTRITPSHMPASFGPPVSDSNSYGNNELLSATSMSSNFLSPDTAFNASGGPTDLRRVRSEGHGHKRNALSADMAPIFADQQSNDMLYPSQTGFRFGSGQGSGVYLSAGMGANMPSAAGAHRRTMSSGNGHGHSRSLSRERVSLGTSPYPSPHASPRANTSNLPDIYGGSGYGAVSSAPTVHVMSHDSQGRPTVQSQQPVQVVRQNVTTHATADASQRRRRTEANFACPVPGCGSTFTRHFNLKGHMRSHNEERPFKCKWPGCDKGFARQHDCKRHEQLHLNIRPYTCNGCSRTFARMDALNRHLRSDAGTECQARQPILTSEDAHTAQNGAGNRNGDADGDGDGAGLSLPSQDEKDDTLESDMGEWKALPTVNGVVV